MNETAAGRLWPGEPAAGAVGRTIDIGSGSYTVVGVVADIRRFPGEWPIGSVYVPITSSDATVAASAAIAMVVRMPPGQPLDRSALRALLEERFSRGGTPAVEAMTEVVQDWLGGPRFRAVLFGAFAAGALALAAAGLFGLAAFDVAQRRFEIGVRMALGATGRQVRQAVVGSTLRPVILGAAAGLVVTWWAAQFLQAFLFEVDARDPWTYAAVALVLVATAVVAAWLPARRAARTDPASVLRAV